MEERNYWLGFSVLNVGPAKFRKLLAEFKTAKVAWTSAGPRLAELAEVKEFSIEEYLKKLKKENVWFITLKDKEYPQLLREIKNPPYLLYGKGSIEVLSDVQFESEGVAREGRFGPTARTDKGALAERNRATGPRATIGIVGARKTTQYGRDVTKLLTQDLVLAGFTIVSGLALGVDAISHMTALENNGKTIAVLGCGVDCCNPAENQSIYDEILKSGNCIISEFPLGFKPTLWSFPARNRIIAGLSEGLVVTEGAEDSGSLITAECALRFGRRVFAVPGPITSQMSKGPFKLISKGAKLVTSARDILQELKVNINNPPPFASGVTSARRRGDTEEENLILKLLENEPLHFDEIIRKIKFNSPKLSSLLSLMEIKGMIKSLGNGTFSS